MLGPTLAFAVTGASSKPRIESRPGGSTPRTAKRRACSALPPPLARLQSAAAPRRRSPRRRKPLQRRVAVAELERRRACGGACCDTTDTPGRGGEDVDSRGWVARGQQRSDGQLPPLALRDKGAGRHSALAAAAERAAAGRASGFRVEGWVWEGRRGKAWVWEGRTGKGAALTGGKQEGHGPGNGVPSPGAVPGAKHGVCVQRRHARAKQPRALSRAHLAYISRRSRDASSGVRAWQ